MKYTEKIKTTQQQPSIGQLKAILNYMFKKKIYIPETHGDLLNSFHTT